MVKFDYITKKKKRELILQIHKFLIIHTENY